MRQNLRIRWVVVAISILGALWYLWPTIRLYWLTSPDKRQEIQQTDPVAWDRLKAKSIKLGLDLQGGMHLVLELDQSQRAFTGDEKADAINRALEIIRNRVDQFGVSEPLIQKVGDERIIVELPGIQDEERAKNLVQRTAFLEFQMVVGEEAATGQIQELDAALAGTTAPTDTTGAAADTTGAAADTTAGDTTAQAAGDTSLAAALQGKALGEADEAGQAAPAAPETTTLGDKPLTSLITAQQLGLPDQIDFYVEESNVPKVKALLADPAARAAMDTDYEWLWGSTKTFSNGRTYRSLYLVQKEPELTGEAVSTAAATYDPQNPTRPIVSLTMTDAGADQFARSTGEHVNERMAIVLDQVVRMAPNIKQRINGGRAQIEGFDSIEEARDIAIVLRAGALPAPLKIIEERTVGPSLGADSIAKGKRAGLLGLLGVILFMILYYRASGVVADIALALNMVLILGALAGFGATLTLPGIAGLILTVGMAVDANVLIFERVREELELGKSVRAALEAGYSRAFVTILDAQITTLIAAAVLFQFGTGPVKGFAVVLTIGILASIFTAVFVTRTIFETWTRTRPAQTLSI